MPVDEFPNQRLDLICPDCGASLVLRSTSSVFYGCSAYPQCKSTHPARADGSPKGTPGNAATRKARIQAHYLFDRVWKEKLVRNRGAAYTWMRKTLGLSRAEAHIGSFDIPQCESLMKAVYAGFPKIRGDRWTALLVDPLED